MAGLGRIYLQQKKIDEARAAFQKSIAMNPEYLDGYKYLLQIAEDQASNVEMLKVSLALHSLSPENPRYPLIIARAHMSLGRLEESERYFKICIALSPTAAQGYQGLGAVYMEMKEYPKAAMALEKALNLEKEDIPTLNSLGLSYIKQGYFVEGIARYKMALAIDAMDARVLFNLGLAYTSKGELSNAIDAFQKAISADPSMEKAKRQLERISKGKEIAASDDQDLLFDGAKKTA